MKQTPPCPRCETSQIRARGHFSRYALLICAGVLIAGTAAPAAVEEKAKIDQKQENLDRRISYTTVDLLEWAPITREHMREGSMTLDALCAAAIEYSDNTAGNLLLRTLGGPAKLTDYVRSLGDSITRLDRVEPDLNSAIKGDERDTTSPAAMLGDIKTFAIAWPPNRPPILIAVYLADSTASAETLNEAFVETARVIAGMF
jgi:Beta-lactamase enzyme family